MGTCSWQSYVRDGESECRLGARRRINESGKLDPGGRRRLSPKEARAHDALTVVTVLAEGSISLPLTGTDG